MSRVDSNVSFSMPEPVLSSVSYCGVFDVEGAEDSATGARVS